MLLLDIVEATISYDIFEALACMQTIFLNDELGTRGEIGDPYYTWGRVSILYVVFKVFGLNPQSLIHICFKILNILKVLFAHFVTFSGKHSSRFNVCLKKIGFSVFHRGKLFMTKFSEQKYLICECGKNFARRFL